MNTLRAAVVRGLGHPVLADIPEQLVQPAILLAALGILVWSSRGLSPASALFAQWLAAVTGLAVGYAIFRLAQPAELATAKTLAASGAWMAGSWASLSVTAGALLEGQLALYLLSWLRNAEDAGHFQAARQIVLLVSFGLVAITLPLQAKLAAAWAVGDLGQAQRLTSAAAQIGFGVALAATIILVPTADWVLGLYGPDYRIAADALRILLVGQLINAAAGPCGVVLGMTGHIHRAPPGILAGLATNAAIAWVAIPYLGLIGAAIAAASGVATYNILWAFRSWQSTKLYTPVIRWVR
jgi:O-antigen/teichoic acid export membrane protein